MRPVLCECYSRLMCSYADRAAVIQLYDTAVSCMAIDYPFYEISAGKRKGLHGFLFVTESEFRQSGESRAKEIEYGRIRSKRISASLEAKRKFSERRAYRRKTEPELRAHELELRRRRRDRMTRA